jgi:hypothetical protein
MNRNGHPFRFGEVNPPLAGGATVYAQFHAQFPVDLLEREADILGFVASNPAKAFLHGILLRDVEGCNGYANKV